MGEHETGFREVDRNFVHRERVRVLDMPAGAAVSPVWMTTGTSQAAASSKNG